AKEGIPVPQVIAHHWAIGGRVLRDQPGFAEVFLPDGRAPREGERFRNPALARTLEAIAEGGREVFYAGAIAEETVRFVREHGGYLSMEDLQNHRSQWVTPVSARYRGYDVHELPPNGQGIAALQILTVMQQFDV